MTRAHTVLLSMSTPLMAWLAVNRYTLDAFAEVAFSVDLGCLSRPQEPTPFALAFDRAQTVMARRFLNPFWRLAEALGGSGTQLARDIATVRDFSLKVRRNGSGTACSTMALSDAASS